jgi:hypothetical protein
LIVAAELFQPGLSDKQHGDGDRSHADFPLRDDPAVRFGGFENMLEFAWR